MLQRVVLGLLFVVSPGLAQSVWINEVYASQTGADELEYIELFGTPGMSLDGHVVAIVEGDQGSAGNVDRIWDLTGSVVPADGYYVLGNFGVANVDFVLGASNTIENGTQTIYVLESTDVLFLFALNGADIDPDGDAVTEFASHAGTTILDAIAFADGGIATGDEVFDGALVLGPDAGAAPAGVLRGRDAPNAWCATAFLDEDAALNANVARTPGTGNVNCAGEANQIGQAICSPAVANSTGASARIDAFGSLVAADNDVRLRASDLPAASFGYFLASRSSVLVQHPGGSQGTLCLGAPHGRLRLQAGPADGAGQLDAVLDLLEIPELGPVAGGESWLFQCWYRDRNPQATTNFSDALELSFE